MRAIWPACRLPMVGTSATFLFSPRARATSARSAPTVSTVCTALRLFSQLRLDCLKQPRIIRCNVRSETSDDRTLAIDQKLLEVPEHVRRVGGLDAVNQQTLPHWTVACGLGLRGCQFGVERMLLGANNRDFREQGKVNVIVH